MIDTKLTKNLISDHDSNFDLGWLGAIVEWLENEGKFLTQGNSKMNAPTSGHFYKCFKWNYYCQQLTLRLLGKKAMSNHFNELSVILNSFSTGSDERTPEIEIIIHYVLDIIILTILNRAPNSNEAIGELL